MQEIQQKCSEAINVREFSALFLSGLAKELEISQGIFYYVQGEKEKQSIHFAGGYALHQLPTEDITFALGEGLVGQVAKDAKPLHTKNIPEGFIISSGLGQASPSTLLIFPFTNEHNNVIALIELASFKEFNAEAMELLNNLNTFVVSTIRQWL